MENEVKFLEPEVILVIRWCDKPCSKMRNASSDAGMVLNVVLSVH